MPGEASELPKFLLFKKTCKVVTKGWPLSVSRMEALDV
jgi:hypothetical protein